MRGQVHDENCYAFGGVTGHAGLFATARELTFACLTNHVYYGRNSPDTLTDFRVAFSRAVTACIDDSGPTIS